VRIRSLLGSASAAALTLVLAAPVAASAQTPAPPSQAQQPPAPSERAPQELRSPVEGELLSVDAEAKKITIQPASGAELEIAYTDTTEISGAQKDAAGLATMKDARVTVHFSENAETKAKTATRIVVQPKG
jgi:Cu/Ag efflux protein CusF